MSRSVRAVYMKLFRSTSCRICQEQCILPFKQSPYQPASTSLSVLSAVLLSCKARRFQLLLTSNFCPGTCFEQQKRRPVVYVLYLQTVVWIFQAIFMGEASTLWKYHQTTLMENPRESKYRYEWSLRWAWTSHFFANSLRLKGVAVICTSKTCFPSLWLQHILASLTYSWAIWLYIC